VSGNRREYASGGFSNRQERAASDADATQILHFSAAADDAKVSHLRDAPEKRDDRGAATGRFGSSRRGNGAQGRNRTNDTAIFNRMLYQLSYLGTG
jgi:hypothetical protein